MSPIERPAELPWFCDPLEVAAFWEFLEERGWTPWNTLRSAPALAEFMADPGAFEDLYEIFDAERLAAA